MKRFTSEVKSLKFIQQDSSGVCFLARVEHLLCARLCCTCIISPCPIYRLRLREKKTLGQRQALVDGGQLGLGIQSPT